MSQTIGKQNWGGGGTNLIPDFAFETKEEDSIRIDLNFHHFLVTAADPDDE
jgi:hypothetical protein